MLLFSFNFEELSLKHAVLELCIRRYHDYNIIPPSGEPVSKRSREKGRVVEASAHMLSAEQVAVKETAY